MIVSAVNDFVWSELQKDTALNAQYDKYRTKYGPNFKPFFPVADNHAGDASWGSECYVLWDSMITRPNRSVFLERHAQILYTIVGPLPALFEFTDAIANSFDFWQSTTFKGAGYRVNDIDAWQPDRIRGRDSLRQTYSSSLILEVHYLTC
jgi:hypothetical protein